MISKLITIFICFNIALGSRLHPKIFNNVEEDFLSLDGEAGSEDHSFDSSNSQDKDFQYKQASCGKPSIKPNTFLRITGGVEAKPHSWPWQISVQDYHGDGLEYYCGGSIISATKIISAAHCFFDTETYKLNPIINMYVIAGIHDIANSFSSTKSQSKKVIKLVPHEKYNPKSVDSPFDIAIVYIAAPGFTFNENVQPICLPTSNVPTETNCYATGWGYLFREQPNESYKLYQVKLPILSNSTCSEWIGEKFISTMICAGDAEGGKDTCRGDSGGPLVCNRGGSWVLDGVTSFGDGCGLPKHPGVYTRVYDYLAWINSN